MLLKLMFSESPKSQTPAFSVLIATFVAEPYCFREFLPVFASFLLVFNLFSDWKIKRKHVFGVISTYFVAQKFCSATEVEN